MNFCFSEITSSPSSSENSPHLKIKLRKPAQRIRNSEKRRIIDSLDSIVELCNDVLNSASSRDLPEEPIADFRSSCASLGLVFTL